MNEVVHSINLIVSQPDRYAGKPYLNDTNIRVLDVVGALQYRQSTPPEIAVMFDITLEQTHAALAYYYGHQAQLDAELAAEDPQELQPTAQDLSNQSANPVDQIVRFCQKEFDLAQLSAEPDVGYPNPVLCVIDAVYSINTRYKAVQNVIENFQSSFPPAKQTLPHLLEAYQVYGVERMADQVFKNRQRTSTKSGILKAEAVQKFAQILATFNAHTNEDVLRLIGNAHFEQQIFAIAGQSSGVSLAYFYMLAGATNIVKPDRMIMRFVSKVTGLNYDAFRCQQLIIAAAKQLQAYHPQITARTLDHLIWQWMT
jgi:uncharacterized protein (DUF433 family)